MAIKFYGKAGKFGEFSNFYYNPIKIDGIVYITTEHYFQSMKYVTVNPEYARKIDKANNPMQAATLGRNRRKPMRPDWEKIKDDVMRKALWEKFTQHPHLKELLLSTGDEEIIENAPNDYYWGCGKKGSGKNMLGKLLVELRGKLRA